MKTMETPHICCSCEGMGNPAFRNLSRREWLARDRRCGTCAWALPKRPPRRPSTGSTPVELRPRLDGGDAQIRARARAPSGGREQGQRTDGPFRPDWASLQTHKTPQWYADAKFGIFIHWGLYSLPAFGSEWYSRNMYVQGSPEFAHHVATYGPQTRFGYKDFIPQFKAEHFDPAAWIALFRDAGARYVVPVAEHHDGFSMYDTHLSDYSTVKMGPKRDVLGELKAAIKAQRSAFLPVVAPGRT